MPDIRRSEAQTLNLPGVASPHVADATAIGAALQSLAPSVGRAAGQAMAAASDYADERSARNVETAYQRLQSAHDAHLNGGAFSLSDDPNDRQEGAALLTRRGRLSENAPDEYSAAMRQVSDRLTRTMTNREREQFNRLAARTAEHGLSVLRRNTDNEMLRYKSDLADASLQTAAAANLSTAVTAYAQNQSFLGGALTIAGRAAAATSDPAALQTAADAIAGQSRSDALDAVARWHASNAQEYERAAEFMRSQGMDEKTIAWRRQEFMEKQGVAMAESLTAQGLYDHADAFLASADKVGLTNPELVGKLRNHNDRSRAAAAERGKAILDAQYDRDAAEIASIAIQDPSIKTQRPNEYILMLQQRAARAQDPRLVKDIERRIDDAQQFTAATIAQREQQQKLGIAAANAPEDAAKAEAVRDMNSLKAGFYIDKNGFPKYLSPVEIEEFASVLHRKTNPDGTPHPKAITQEQYEDIMATAAKGRDRRSEEFHQRIAAEVLHKFKDPIRRRLDTFSINPEEKKLTPSTVLFRNEFRNARGKLEREDVTASTLLQFANVVHQQMQLDKQMTPADAVEKFKKLAAGTLQGYEDETAAESLEAQAKILTDLRDSHARNMNPKTPISTK